MKYIYLLNTYIRGPIKTTKQVECILLTPEEFNAYLGYLDEQGSQYHSSKQNVYFEGIHILREDKLKPAQEYSDIKDVKESRRLMLQKLGDILQMKETING